MTAKPLQVPGDSAFYRWGALGIVVIIAALWELAVRTHVASGMFVPAPSEIFRELAQGLWGGSLLTALGTTALRVVSGLLIGGLAGALFGLLMGASRRLSRLLNPLIAAVHPIPKLSLLPLFMVFFGLGETPKVIVVSAAAFFPMLLSTMAGVRHIAAVHFDAARTYGASRRQLITSVVIPGSVPMMLSGLRLAANIAFLSAIAVEMVAAKNGLGAEVWLAWQVLRLDELFATLVVIAAVGVVVNFALRRLSRRIAPWLTARELTI
ncbi:MAG TPA: ABC transporter permease [Gemmatimonadaceae bacterium]|jgi:NitT/TauT family transport system permease protein|nr:ABC transporter permease [Gemmatimonadaceae bacterium]